MSLDLEKLAAICEMLGSSHESERAVAALKANKMVRGAGFTWREMFLALQKPAPSTSGGAKGGSGNSGQRPPNQPQTANERRAASMSRMEKVDLLKACQASIPGRAIGSSQYLTSMADWVLSGRELTMRQTATLLSIYERYTGKKYKP